MLQCLQIEPYDFTRQPPWELEQPSDDECVRALLAQLVDAVWALSAVLGLSFNLISLFIATLSAITGPGLALRGPEGALLVAVTHMEQQHKRALRFFGRGICAFACSILGFGLQALSRFNLLKCIIICTAFIWTISAIVVYGADIGAKFHLAASTAVRGEFDTNK